MLQAQDLVRNRSYRNDGRLPEAFRHGTDKKVDPSQARILRFESKEVSGLVEWYTFIVLNEGDLKGQRVEIRQDNLKYLTPIPTKEAETS